MENAVWGMGLPGTDSNLRQEFKIQKNDIK